MGIMRHNEMFNVGHARYVVNYHDGIKKHKDGSDFFDMMIFKNKNEKDSFLKELENKGSIYSSN